MNKKGFTLFEIIICLTLIIIISTITIVSLKKKPSNENEKIENEVKTSADVYYSMNKELQKKLTDNSGFLVLTIEELNNMGIIDADEIKSNLKNYDDKYDKIVIIDEPKAFGDKTGTLKLIYPYVNNPHSNFVKNLNSITIEYFEKDHFECNWGIDEDAFKYIDADWNSVNLTYNCNVDDIKNITSACNKDINYDLSNGTSATRTITINPKYEPEISVKTLYSNIDKTSICTSLNNDEKWLNEYVNVTFKDTDFNGTDNLTHKYELKNVDTNDILTENKNEFDINYDGKFKIEFTSLLKGKYVDIEESNSKNCEIFIDTIEPTIAQNINTINISDSGSGVSEYIVSDHEITDLDNETWIDYNNTIIDISDNERDYYIYAKDKAGNIETHSIINSEKPIIIVEPIPNTISKFRITINSNTSITDANLEYKLGEFVGNLPLDNAIGLTEYSLEIDITALHTGCYNDYYNCRKKFNPKANSNLTIPFEISLKNSEGYARKYKIDATQNLKVSNGYYFKTYDGKTINDIVYINQKNDILHGYSRNPSNKYEVGEFNFYNFSNEVRSFLGSNSSNIKKGDNFIPLNFNNEYVEYALCGCGLNYRGGLEYCEYYYTIYKYNISTNTRSIINTRDNLSEYCTEYLPNSTINANYAGTYTNISNENYGTIQSYFAPMKQWEKDLGYYDPAGYNLNLSGQHEKFEDKIYIKRINGIDYHTVMIYENYKHSKYLGRVEFLPDVTLNKTLINEVSP